MLYDWVMKRIFIFVAILFSFFILGAYPQNTLAAECAAPASCIDRVGGIGGCPVAPIHYTPVNGTCENTQQICCKLTPECDSLGDGAACKTKGYVGGGLCGIGYTPVDGRCTDINKVCCKQTPGTGPKPPSYGGEFGGPGTTFSCGSGANAVWTLDCIFPLLANLIYYGLLLAGAVAVIFIIIGGIRLITSGGDPKAVVLARKIISFTVLGLVLIFLSFFLLNFIAKVTGVACLSKISTSTLPTFQSCQP